MGTVDRREFLKAVLAGSTVGLAGCTQSDGAPNTNDSSDGTDGTPPGSNNTNGQDGDGTTDGDDNGTTDGTQPNSVGLETLATGMRAPLDVAFVPNSEIRYIADQTGLIYTLESGDLRDQPLLDLRDKAEFGGEKGLLGIALHPNFAENDRLFVRYSAPRRKDTPSNYSHTFVLAEFEVTDDRRKAKRDSERTVLEIPEPQSNHNAGDIVFGPDDYLYIAVGDGGAGGDIGRGHVEDWYNAVGGGNGQDVTENLLGSILRIDVDDREDGKGYAIPDDNPLVGEAGLDEHYAWGLRNPWRMSFDGDDFFVGDVGQNRYEEVDLVEKGGNYGWNVKEGTHCYGADNCPDRTPDSIRGGEPLIDPIIEYPHSGAPVSGRSVIGGYVYRGSALPEMDGTYIFGDLVANGRLFGATRPDDGGMWPTRVIEVADNDSEKISRVLSFGQDNEGEVYVLGTGSGGGGLHRLVPPV
ncbi:MAG: PQQ-dependent sugar dehydrogenase [Halobacteria archaeon]|nr:PQQ-dependent sugar dehydrogenase [Halobacteria archaeon]